MADAPRKILLVVTTGGFTHATPVLELGRVLAERGHKIEFATLEGQEGWVKGYDFISELYLLGPGPTEEQLDEHYRRMRKWDVSHGLGGVMDSKYLFDSFWPENYRRLKAIMEDPSTRPAMIIGDFFVDAVKDMHVQFDIPITMVWPTMPLLMLPCSYIPGQPGFQLEGTLTSETASIWLRIKNELVILKSLPVILKFLTWTKRQRRMTGVHYRLPSPKKPDYLILVNSFFGLEIPRDLPPLCAPVGPILADEYPPLDPACDAFLSMHQKVIYIALGTHIILDHHDAVKIITALCRLLEDGWIDGVIWAVGKSGRQNLQRDQVFDFKGQVVLGDLLDGKNPSWLFPFFAPQRAILEHSSTIMYFTHGGGSSANEALYHGKPILAMGVFSDQIANTTKLVAGGVAESINKFRFTSDEMYTKIKRILEDSEGLFARNCLRLKRIARVGARRKQHGADLIEEVMYDTELRFRDGKELRPMHLQTADMRMPAYKAKNWDLMAVTGLGVGAMMGSTYLVSTLLWAHREIAISSVRALVGRISSS
ncbi:glycosyltransferase family 1 protein [Coleophoma cylindrospora]|uniref:Glycosyltransferase family 1 protein n=1 Tax=Coleophoma cylindrospora TaxID=1849047 RepID=A0A3D8Q8T0_9HELO|nr:glycosyltransferase family 1 protein [Coleophoma cylindrospora]